MSILELIAALRATDGVLYVDDAGVLRYAGPRLAADSAIRAAIATQRAVLRELFTYAPEGRCAEPDCYRLPDHEGEHLALDAGHGGTTEVAA